MCAAGLRPSVDCDHQTTQCPENAILDAADHPEDETGDEDRAKDGDARESVRTTVENLRHLAVLPSGIEISKSEGQSWLPRGLRRAGARTVRIIFKKGSDARPLARQNVQ